MFASIGSSRPIANGRLFSSFASLAGRALLVALLAAPFGQAAGMTWSPATPVETGSKPAFAPKIAVDQNGNVMAVWVQWDENETAYHVYSNQYVTGSGWGTPTLLESSNTGWGAVSTMETGSESAFGAKVAVDSLVRIQRLLRELRFARRESSSRALAADSSTEKLVFL